MAIHQSIDSALEKNVGPHDVADKALAVALGRAEGALETLRDQHANGLLPLLRPPETRDDLPAIRAAGRRLAENATAAESRATAETLAKNGCPVRRIHLPLLDEESLGELLMHFMLETIVTAHLIGVDAFDQPTVEEGKVLAKKYLTS
jgi:glucose-6-phosphate isomerase